MASLYKSVCYCTNLRRSANTLSDIYDASLKSTGLTAAQYYHLITLWRLGSANITHWAEHVGLERSTMVRNIRPLQKKGLIETVPGRGKTFALSDEGKRILNLAVPLWQNAQTKIEAILGKKDIEALFRISEKLQGASAKDAAHSSIHVTVQRRSDPPEL